MPENAFLKYTGREYWKNYLDLFAPELIEKWYQYGSHDWIDSCGSKIHLEIYDTRNHKAPVLIFSHGIAGYARLLLPFLVPLRETGYNIIAPDLHGYGYNSGLKGDFEWNIHVQNLGDTVKYARKRFSGKIVLGGASMGGPLAYAAASRFQNVDALACWCLWDPSEKEFLVHETRTKKLTFILIPFFKVASSLMGKVGVKTYYLVSYEGLSESRLLNDLVKGDPLAGTHITLKAAVSLITQSKPDILHNQFKIPTLVVQPGADLMTPLKYTKRVFNKLACEKKRYVELEGASHLPVQKKFYDMWAEAFDEFVRLL
jgi:alpha-beta hydrolase superfamily lysophospholipase